MSLFAVIVVRSTLRWVGRLSDGELSAAACLLAARDRCLDAGHDNSFDSDDAHELAGHTHAACLEEQRQSGVASGVTSTPTFFIDGLRYNGSVSLPKPLSAIANYIRMFMLTRYKRKRHAFRAYAGRARRSASESY